MHRVAEFFDVHHGQIRRPSRGPLSIAATPLTFPTTAATYRLMQDDPTPAPKPTQIERERAAKQARVAAALRANLMRRKAQARARAEDQPDALPDADTPQDQR